jgi:hypothetical protein
VYGPSQFFDARSTSAEPIWMEHFRLRRSLRAVSVER